MNRYNILALCALGFLWFRLIDHLRVEWSVNPQYSYGWAVPFLCLYLAWKRLRREQGAPPKLENATDQAAPPSFAWFALGAAALAWLPTRLIQEANPEWRAVSWALALEVILLTLAIVALRDLTTNTAAHFGLHPSRRNLLDQAASATTRPNRGGPRETRLESRTTNLAAALLFPLGFFLVAVPWPTVVEGPLIQGLARANTAATAELLDGLGVPALPHGNVLEVGTGLVGIDDACSGIRSFQATLMLSLFFGQLCRLDLLRRAVLCLVGFGLSFVFNLARTTLLAWVAAQKGSAAIASWHDPAGVTILLGCFIALWALAWRLTPCATPQVPAASANQPCQGGALPPNAPSQSALSPATNNGRSDVPDAPAPVPVRGRAAAPTPRRAALRSGHSPMRWVALGLCGWLLLVEAGTELWYRAHESQLPKALAWRLALPRDNPTLRTVALSAKAKQFLRYDDAANGVWEEADGTRWQAIFLRWNPGRIAPRLARSHTPAQCLTAAGRELKGDTHGQSVRVSGLDLPFHSYAASDPPGALHVFYCLWEDRADAQGFSAEGLTYANRLVPVRAGRRNCGQRSLEVAVWGIPDAAEAETALQRQLEKIVCVEPNR